jgi:sodium/potassium/calcium exchanger 6
MSTVTRKRAWFLLAATITIHLVISRSSAKVKTGHHPSSDNHSLLRRSLETNVSPHVSFPARPSDQTKTSTTLLSLPYPEYYSSLPPSLRPLALTVLGLSESTAGVTFLAFGNGSPDVFSTFAALRGGTFGLAVGELIGAASFSE